MESYLQIAGFFTIYTRVVLISIYRVCCWKGQKVHKKLHTINNSSKIDRNIWKLKPSYSQQWSNGASQFQSSETEPPPECGAASGPPPLVFSSQNSGPTFLLVSAPGLLQSPPRHSRNLVWRGKGQVVAGSRGGKYSWREIIGKLTVFIVLLWLPLFLFSSDNVISAVK